MVNTASEFTMFGKKKAPAISSDRLQSAVSKKDVAPRRVHKSRAPRLDTWADCEITWPLGPTVPGVMVDLSETGARVRFRHRGVMPTEVRIICRRLKIDRMATVVRRDLTEIGVHFIS